MFEMDPLALLKIQSLVGQNPCETIVCSVKYNSGPNRAAPMAKVSHDNPQYERTDHQINLEMKKSKKKG